MNWLIPANGKIYDHKGSFMKFGFADWRETVKYEIGDTVYLYCTTPDQKIMYKAVVEKIHIPFEQANDDREFWIDKKAFSNASLKKYARLHLTAMADSVTLSLNALKKHGLFGAPQGAMRLRGELLDYIEQRFSTEVNKTNDFIVFWAEISELYEGKEGEYYVHMYERNPIARKRCIELNGCSCAICGFSFLEKYGTLGEGFIEVHHINPLSTRSGEHHINIAHDLIPVCSNCHVMLHHNTQSHPRSIDELKELI